MVTKKEQKDIDRIIKKHYGKGSRFKTRGWEQCGREIERYIENKFEKFQHLSYSELCDKESEIRRNIQGYYESYFKVGSMYNWVNGNENLKTLINT